MDMGRFRGRGGRVVGESRLSVPLLTVAATSPMVPTPLPALTKATHSVTPGP